MDSCRVMAQHMPRSGRESAAQAVAVDGSGCGPARRAQRTFPKDVAQMTTGTALAPCATRAPAYAARCERTTSSMLNQNARIGTALRHRGVALCLPLLLLLACDSLPGREKK